MNKKISGILIMILTIGVFASCSSKDGDTNVSSTSETGVESSVETNAESDKNVEISDIIKVDKKAFSVEITLPSSMVENQEDFNEESYINENPGIKSAKFNDDGSFTTVMSKKKHREIVADMKEGLDNTIKDIAADETTYPQIKEIEANKNYDNLKVKVDKETYKEDFDVALYILSMNIGIYQVYNGDEFHSTFEIYDIENDELINTVVYPDDLED